MQLKSGELFYTSIVYISIQTPIQEPQRPRSNRYVSLSEFNELVQYMVKCGKVFAQAEKRKVSVNGTPNVDQATQAEHIPTSYIVAAKPRKTTAANAAAET